MLIGQLKFDNGRRGTMATSLDGMRLLSEGFPEGLRFERECTRAARTHKVREPRECPPNLLWLDVAPRRRQERLLQLRSLLSGLS